MEPKTFSDNLTVSIPADFDFCEFEMTFKNNVDGDWVEQRASLLPCLQQMLDWTNKYIKFMSTAV